MRIAIIGAGAAGCFAAANIPYAPGREVVVFEKSNKVMQKVKVSGGGRCNVTHACFDIPELLKKYPRGQRFLRKTLYEFTPQHTIDWFKQRGVELKAEVDGRMFPITDESQTIIDCIWQQLQQNKVQVRYGKAVKKIERVGAQLILHFADDSAYAADKVLIACGGFPKAEQFNWLKETGHTILEPVPSLFTFNMPKHPITELMGLSVEDVGVKYSYGGNDKSGIDCSAFVQKAYEEVFCTELVRTARDQFHSCRMIWDIDNLIEGDLVFFRTRGKRISHVGIYLANNFFVHASSTGGVMISSLTEAYWSKRFAGAGKIPKGKGEKQLL